jgi:hypothetical protein
LASNFQITNIHSQFFVSKEAKINNFFWKWIFRENKFLLYFQFIPRFCFFFPLDLWYSHIGNHPQEGLISVTSNQKWYMGIFWNSSYGRPWTIPKTISQITIWFSCLIVLLILIFY